jgi:transcription initiation factor IIE alpha subunit
MNVHDARKISDTAHNEKDTLIKAVEREIQKAAEKNKYYAVVPTEWKLSQEELTTIVTYFTDQGFSLTYEDDLSNPKLLVGQLASILIDWH